MKLLCVTSYISLIGPPIPLFRKSRSWSLLIIAQCGMRSGCSSSFSSSSSGKGKMYFMVAWPLNPCNWQKGRFV
eukprot:1161965-Pelagomonas_calceolata.AAC.3